MDRTKKNGKIIAEDGKASYGEKGRGNNMLLWLFLYK